MAVRKTDDGATRNQDKKVSLLLIRYSVNNKREGQERSPFFLFVCALSTGQFPF